MDMSQTVAPKSDQLNTDDLIAGPRTIRIERVSGSGNPDQPVNVHFEGDGSKPYRPCKSMRRVMIAAWGADATQYVGRSLTIYRDPKVAFGGMEVGGIRISHMSHIERDLSMALTVTKAKRAPFVVKVLPAAAPKRSKEEVAEQARQWATDFRARLDAAPDAAALTALLSDGDAAKKRKFLADSLPDVSAELEAAIEAACTARADG